MQLPKLGFSNAFVDLRKGREAVIRGNRDRLSIPLGDQERNYSNPLSESIPVHALTCIGLWGDEHMAR